MKHIIVAIAAVVLTASSIPSEVTIKDSCAYVEINHVYNIDDETGKANLRMVQYIWWKWNNHLLLPEKGTDGKNTGDWVSSSGFVVREYLVTYSGSSRPENVSVVSLIKRNGKYICIFWDRQDKILREVTCGWVTETHTTYDVEIENRDIIRTEDRNHFHKR
tara:strand:- start:275 stop:760 length:486 start_codon:yes stop_codon:yes gene_type:complete